MWKHLNRWFQNHQRSEAASNRRFRIRPQLEALEDRVVPTTFNVNSLADVLNPTAGVVTLRSAIQAANATPGDNTINLTVAGDYKIALAPTNSVLSAVVTNGGSYTFDPAVLITGGGGTGAVGEAMLTNGQVTSVMILNGGTGYTSAPTINILGGGGNGGASATAVIGVIPNALGAFAVLPTGGNLVIQNTSGGTVSLDGNNLSRVLDINPNVITPMTKSTVTITGVTIMNGVASPGDNAIGSGGGIRDQGPISLTLDNDIITNNTATADGGGVSMENTVDTPWTLTLNATTVSDNHAGDAGGGVETDGSGNVFINSGCVITGNTAVNQGGGVWLDAIGNDSANLSIQAAVVSDNSAFMVDGGIGNAGNGGVSITDCTIENNFSEGDGGGFGDQNNMGTLTVLNSYFFDNNAGGNGGGVQEGGPTTTITDTAFQGNSSGGSGGAVIAAGTTLNISTSTFAGNTAAVGGGGLEVQTTSFGVNSSSITNSTITGNRVLNNGGNGNGGGIEANTLGLILTSDTINGNFADNGGGVIQDQTMPSVLFVQNTIIAQNSASVGGPDVLNVFSGQDGVLEDNGGNLFGIADGVNFFGIHAGTSQFGTTANPLNPLLGPLANNGGAIGIIVGPPGASTFLLTEALVPGSPAINKGVANPNVTRDERGVSRPAVAGQNPDVGAFEFQNVRLSITAKQTGAPVIVGGVATITITIANTGATALPNDNSTLTVTLSTGLTATSPLTFTLNPLAAGQSQTFVVTATAAALGSQMVTAVAVSPDANNNIMAGVGFAVSPALDTVVIGTDGSLKEIDPNGVSTTISPTGTILSASAVLDADGTTVVYAISTGLMGAQYQNTLWEYTHGAWSEESSGFFQQISAATNSSGQPVVFGVIGKGEAGFANALFEQSSAFGTVGLNTGFKELSGPGTVASISAITDHSGNDVVYAIWVGTNNLYEHSPAFSGNGWQQLSTGSFAQVSAGLNSAGQAVSYSVLTNGQLYEQNPALGPTGLNLDFELLSGVNGLPATFKSVTAGGPDTAFGIASDGTIWEHNPSGNKQLSAVFQAKQLSATRTQQGADEVFMTLIDGSFWEYSTALPSSNPFVELLPSGAAASATPVVGSLPIV